MLGLGRRGLSSKIFNALDIVPVHSRELLSRSSVYSSLFLNYRSMGDVIVLDNTMREIIVLDDDDDEPSPSSQPQPGLSEAQRLRMSHQKQLAMARLQARKSQQTEFPFRKPTNLTSMLHSPAPEPVHRAGGIRGAEFGDKNMGGKCFGLDLSSGHPSSVRSPSQQFRHSPPFSEVKSWTERGGIHHTTESARPREPWFRSEHADHTSSIPFSNSYVPLGSSDPRDPMLTMPCDRDEDVEDGSMPIRIPQRRKSREFNMSTMGVEGGEKRAKREKDVSSVDAMPCPPPGTIGNYFHRTDDAPANSNTSERFKMQNGREGNAGAGMFCAIESTNTHPGYASPRLPNGMIRRLHEDQQGFVGGSGNMGNWGATLRQHVSPDNSNINGARINGDSRCLEVPGEVVGEWRSVRKTSAPGSSYGRQVTMPSNHMNHFESEPWESSERQTFPPNAKTVPHAFSSSNSSAKVTTSIQGVPEVATTTPSKQQMQVLKAIAEGKSVFVTGSAGTGKSFILEDALRVLRRNYGEDAVFVTASTGLAACVLGGTTVHSFAGIGVENETKEQLAAKVSKNRDVRARWLKAKALIIDEISMIDGELFDTLEHIASCIKGKKAEKVWGGIQLVVTGDFYQLPPVKPKNPQKYFAFQASCWEKSFDVQLELTQVFRQSDTTFVSMLNEIRRGVCSPSTLQRLRHCNGYSGNANSGIELTRLYPRIMDVSHENDQNLRALGNDMLTYTAKDDALNDFGRRQLNNLRAAAIQPLCMGAQVMLTKNLELGMGLVNGARGVVVRFSTPDDSSTTEYQKLAKHIIPTNQWPIVRFACDGLERLVGPESWSVYDGGKEIAKRTQIPLMLAWAISVHKCQGMTLDRVETNLSRAFDHGMVYVALSRVKSLQGLHLIDFDPSRIKTHPLVAKFYEGLNRNHLNDGNFE